MKNRIHSLHGRDAAPSGAMPPARVWTQPCPRCGHVYKKAGLALPDGTCRNPKACDRHIERGY